MKHIIVLLFVVSLLGVSFLALNYLWHWVDINYTSVVKAALSVLIGIMAITGLMMVFKSGYANNPDHPDVGKK